MYAVYGLPACALRTSCNSTRVDDDPICQGCILNFAATQFAPCIGKGLAFILIDFAAKGEDAIGPVIRFHGEHDGLTRLCCLVLFMFLYV